jgi:hypothetical protein
MRATNVSLNASVSPAVEDRCVRWTTYSNLHAWFVSIKAFLIEFGFATIGSGGRLVFLEAMLRRIANVDKTEVSLDSSKTDDPKFDAFADVQSKNDYSTTQLTMMGYKGELLRAQYHETKSERCGLLHWSRLHILASAKRLSREKVLCDGG